MDILLMLQLGFAMSGVLKRDEIPVGLPFIHALNRKRQGWYLARSPSHSSISSVASTE